MQAYESPKVTFQQLTLFEKIAHSCWSATSAFYDMNHNGRSDGHEALTIKTSSCAGNNNSILQQMYAKLGLFYTVWYWTSGACNTDTLTNTGASGIRCDFTSGGSQGTPTPIPSCGPPKPPHGH